MSDRNGQTPYRRSVNARTQERTRTRAIASASREQRSSRSSTRNRTSNSRSSKRDTSYSLPKKQRFPLAIGLVLLVVALSVVIGLVVHSCATFGREASDPSQQGQSPTPTDKPATAQTGFTHTDSSARHGSFEEYSDFAIWRSEDERKATSDSTNETLPGTHVAYLTFDDGPSENTRRILEILDKYDIKATWFVKGNVGDIALVKDIWEAGHQIAIHTYSHEYEEIYATDTAFWDDIDHAGEIINGYLGFTPTLIRFPGGSHNSFNGHNADQLTSQVHQRGWHYFDWNVSCGDSGSDRSVERLLQNTINEAEGNNSSMILMHDDGAKVTTVDALESIIQWLIRDGYTFDVVTCDTFGYHF